MKYAIFKIGKPNQAIFEILLERYQLKPKECLFIDDNSENTKAAATLGISTITFKGSAACYEKIYAYL